MPAISSTLTVRLSLALLAVGLVLTSATQLRTGPGGLGPGEMLLSGWVAFACCLVPRLRMTPWGNETGRYLLAFWLVCALAMTLGWFSAEPGAAAEAGASGRDALAYVLGCAVSVLVVSHPASESDLQEMIAGYAAVSSAVFAALWFYGTRQPEAIWIDPWYGSRFSGWAQNPNQIAFFLAPIPFMLLHALRRASSLSGHLRSCLWTVVLSLALATGWATGSAALLLAWMLCLGGTWLKLGWQWSRGVPGAAHLLAWCLSAVSLATILVLVNNELRGPVERLTTGGFYAPDDLRVRWQLLENGLKAVAHSPWTGHGPGIFSGLDGPFRGSEAHNTPLDWMTQTGAVGGLALVGLVGWVMKRLYEVGQAELLTGLLSLAIFAEFHHVLRQPALWTWIAVLGLLSARGSLAPDVSASKSKGAQPQRRTGNDVQTAGH